MIGFVTIGAKDSAASGKFYDAVFTTLGDERKFTDGAWIGYGPVGPDKSITSCHTMLCTPYDGKEAHSGNGIMIAFTAPSREAVMAAYEVGLANGGIDEGKPGFRPPQASSGFFGAYLRDPTGNKIFIFILNVS